MRLWGGARKHNNNHSSSSSKKHKNDSTQQKSCSASEDLTVHFRDASHPAVLMKNGGKQAWMNGSNVSSPSSSFASPHNNNNTPLPSSGNARRSGLRDVSNNTTNAQSQRYQSKNTNQVAAIKARIDSLRRESHMASSATDNASLSDGFHDNTQHTMQLASQSKKFFEDDAIVTDINNVLQKKLTSRPTEYRLRALELTSLAKEAKRVLTLLLKRKESFVNACHDREMELVQSIDGVKLQKSSAEASSARLERDIETCRATIAKYKADMSRLEESLRISEQAASREGRNASLMSQDLAAAERRAEAAEAAKARTEQHLEKTIADLKASSRKAAEDAHKEQDTLRAALRKAQEELTSARATFEAERRGLSTSTKEQLETMLKSLEQQKAAASELRQQHAMLSDAHGRLERTHAQALQELESQKVSSSATERNASHLEMRIEGLQGELRREKDAFERFSASATEREEDLRKSLAVADERRMEMNGEMSRLQADVAALEARLAAARSQAHSVDDERKSVELRLSELATQHDSSISEVKDLNEEKLKLTAENARFAADLQGVRDELARASAAATAEAEAHERTSVLLTSKNVLVTQLQEERETLKTEVSNTAERLSAERANRERLDATIKTLRDDAAAMQVLCSERHEKIMALEKREEQIAKSLAEAELRLTKETEDVIAIAAQRDEAISKAAEEKDARAVAETALMAEQAHTQAMREEVSRQRADLEAQLGDARKSLAVATSDLNEAMDIVSCHRGASAPDSAARLRAWTQLEAVLFGDVGVAHEDGGSASPSADGDASPAARRKQRNVELERQVEELTANLTASETERRKLHNTIQELRGNVRVLCRLRPQSGDGSTSAVRTLPASGPMTRDGVMIATPGTPASAFEFDAVFGPDSTQESVFVEVSELVQSALDGYKVCLFCYGQTGSGKTHTMLGSGQDPHSRGIVPRAVEKVIEASQANRIRGWEYEMEASYVEIYNEMVRDLLSPGSCHSEKHSIITAQSSGSACPQVSGVQRKRVTTVDEAQDLVRRAAAARKVEATRMNATSSRSHTLFMLYITGVHADSGQKLEGFLCLVDLAGSERVDKSGAEGARLKEACAINKSLSSLSDVFSAISKGQKHIPYRNSKLTHLLAPCLGGDGKALMFVNLNGEKANAEESLASLRFASTVNSCELGLRGGGAKRSVSTVDPNAAKVPTARPQTAPTKSTARPQTAPASGRPTRLTRSTTSTTPPTRPRAPPSRPV